MTALRDMTAALFGNRRLCEYCLKLIPLEQLRNIGGAYICRKHRRTILFLREGNK